MAWVWTSDFASDQNIWVPINSGFEDWAIYTGGVGFEYSDAQLGAGSYSRILGITATLVPQEINTIAMNFDLTKGAVAVGGSICYEITAFKSGGGSVSDSVIFNDATNGTDKDFELDVNELDIDLINIFCRSSGQASASFSGSVILNYITITGGEGNPFDSSGSFKTPDIFIDDQGGGAAGGAGGGAGGNVAAISADGLYIYIASFDILGFPTLIRMPAPLNGDGSVVFEPGAGGRIGVQAGELNAETVWVAGQFDGTNTVEKSEDSGATFTVKDNGVFGTVRTFQVGGGNDDRVIVFDGDNGDILETLDDGATWTTINAAVTPLINSIARLSVDLQESVFGNEGGITDSINYSPNSGANLEDYQTGVYPNEDATKVQVT